MKTNTVSDTSSVDRHTLRLQTRKHRTVLKTKKEVKQITTKQRKLESALCGDANPRRLQRQSCCG